MFRRNLVAHGGRRAKEKGFTLVELMITLVILGLILSVVYRMFSSQERFFRTQEQVAAMQENLRATAEYMNQELSWIGYNVSGIAVLKASPNEVIFSANIPDTGISIQYVRYLFNPTINAVSRAAGIDSDDIADSQLRIMAADIEALSFSYFNVLNHDVLTSAADPLCATILPQTVCSPGTPSTDDEDSLLNIHRVKARVTARTSRPDWLYSDPSGSEASRHFRKRSAVLDVKARNIEEDIMQAGQINLHGCGDFTPQYFNFDNYVACPDKISYMNSGYPDLSGSGLTDNPKVTIEAMNGNGDLYTNPGDYAVVITATAEDGTTLLMYDPDEPATNTDTIVNGEERYFAAGDLSCATAGQKVWVQITFSSGVCTATRYQIPHPISIAASSPSHFDTTEGLSASYINLDTGNDLGLSSPAQVAMCSSVSRQGILLTTPKIQDDCLNFIVGESVTWDDGGAGGDFIDQEDNGDGTYSATYVPPDTMAGLPDDTYAVTLSAHWGTQTLSTTQTLKAAQAEDILIDEITDVLNAGIFQFSRTVDNSSGSTFAIERIDGQDIGILFHVEDACGNWVFGESPKITKTTSTGYPTSPLTSNPDGTYYFEWAWGGGCGLEMLGENITINDSSIANPSTQNEVITVNLLTTRSQTDQAGPFVVMDKIADPGLSGLLAGKTYDYVSLEAQVLEYDAIGEFCTNIPGVFPVAFTVAGGPGGNGSFSAVSFDEITKTVNTGSDGKADVRLYSGTADWDDTLSITAAADVAGAVFQGTIDVGMLETNPPHTESGFYSSSSYLTRIGSDQPLKTFNPGASLYLQVFDFDENEDPLQMDSMSVPYTSVTVTSGLTGDRETVHLQEWAANNAEFRRALPTEYSGFANPGDGTLQVLDGDTTVSLYYEDKDNPADNQTWTVHTPQADFFKVFLVEGAGEVELVGPVPFQEPVTYGDRVRPKLSLPFLAGDGKIGVDTVEITVNSGFDEDHVVLKEEGDTGILVPDWDIYTGDYITLLEEEDPDVQDILETPTTPRYVTLTYSAAAGYTLSTHFFMKDMDPPSVKIIAPADGAIVSGTVPVLVEASDVANATSWAGIDHVDLYINGRFVATTSVESSPGEYSFSWITAKDGLPYWLDGGHTITAVAVDNGSNQATSDPPVNVTVLNSLTPIWFTEPEHNSIWSGDVNIGVGVNMAAEAGTYEVTLYDIGMAATLASWTDRGTDTFPYTYITASLPEGTNTLRATLVDSEGKEEFNELDLVVDRTEPDITIGPIFDQAWINIVEFPNVFTAEVFDPKVAPADPNDVDDETVKGAFSGICTLTPTTMAWEAGDTYSLNTEPSWCQGAEGLLTFTVVADDLAQSVPNHASVSETAMVDTKRPVINPPLTVSMENYPFTMGSFNVEGFVSGDVTLSATITDAYPASGVFLGWFYNDPLAASGTPDGTLFQIPSGPYLDATSGTLSFTGSTEFSPGGIYVLQATVRDAAGNSNNTSPERVVYLDNTEPWGDVWVSDPGGLYRGLVYRYTTADDWVGFLRKVQYKIVHTGTGTIAWEGTLEYDAADQVRRHQEVDIMDLSGWMEGSYECQSTVSDWAGNTRTNSWTNCFEIFPEVALDPVNPIPMEVVFSPVGSTGPYTALLQGGTLEDGLGWGIPGRDIEAWVVRYVWDPVWGYEWADSDWQMMTTGPAGELPPTGLPMLFESTDMAEVEYYLVDPWQWLGSMRAYLGSPMDGTPADFQVFEEPAFSLVGNLDLIMTPSGVDYFTLQITGNLLRSSGDPALGVTMRIHTSFEDPPGFWKEDDFIDETSHATGAFSFSPPLLFPYDSWINIEFYDDREEFLGSAHWDPWLGMWQVWF